VLSLPPRWSADRRYLVRNNDSQFSSHGDHLILYKEASRDSMRIGILRGGCLRMLGIHPRRRLSNVRLKSRDPHHFPHSSAPRCFPGQSYPCRSTCVRESVALSPLRAKVNVKSNSVLKNPRMAFGYAPPSNRRAPTNPRPN
jgi:hypothetical protein